MQRPLSIATKKEQTLHQQLKVHAYATIQGKARFLSGKGYETLLS